MPRFERIALCVIAVQLVLIFIVWAITPEREPAPQAPPLPELLRSCESTYYEIHSHDATNPARLGPIADRTHREARRWLEVPAAPDEVDRRLPIYVCDSLGSMREATEHVFWPSAPDSGLLRPALGRYFGRERGIVAVGVEPRVHNTVAHEVVHHVIDLFAPNCPIALNEGAAVYLANTIDVGATPASLHRTRNRQIRQLGPQTLRSVIEMDSAEFHGTHKHAHYALAFVTVRFLAESEDPEIRGRLPRLFASIDRNRDPWARFCSVYREPVVTRQWQQAIDSLLKRRAKRTVKPQ